MSRRATVEEARRVPTRGMGLQGGGTPLDPATRSVMEARFGHDFAQVRIHDDAVAQAMAAANGARAVTEGDDITLGAGATAAARNTTLAHELAHVVQQGLPGPTASVSRVEAEAQTAADRVTSGQPAVIRWRAPAEPLFQDEQADAPDLVRGTVRTRLSPDLGRVIGRQRSDGGLTPGTLMNRADTEALLQTNISHERRNIPEWTDMAAMGKFDSYFWKNPGRFDFRGHEMEGWEVNYYFVSMAMAHQGWDWNETQAIIWTWNTSQTMGLNEGDGKMTPEMWFAAQQGFDDEQARMAREALGSTGLDAVKSPATPPAAGAGGPSMSPAPP